MNRSTRTVLFALTALALFARVLVPAGYMPAPVGSGWPVQLCGDGIPASVMAELLGLHNNHQQHHHHHHAAHDHGEAPQECELGAGFATDLSPALSLDLVELQITGDRAEEMRAALPRAKTPHRYRSRAPPALA